jgi:L-threonylcarbamoyladenylate synthase
VRLLDASALPRIAADLPGPVGALVRSDIALPGEVVSVRLPQDPAGYARDLYAALRDLEDRGCTSICVESVPASPEWDAIRDRLTRASA